MRALIENYLEEILVDFPVYCCYCEVKGHTIEIHLDADQGVSIGTISKITRKLNHMLDEEGCSETYHVEVGTAGVGNNFTHNKQYKTNIGRDLKLVIKSNSDFTGKLVAINEEYLWMLQNKEIKKIKKEIISKSKVVIV